MKYEIVNSPWVRKALPIALTAVAGAGVIGTAVLAAKATPAAIEKKEEAEKEKGEPLTTWEKLKAMAPSYLPAAGTGIATLGAIGGLVLDSNKKQAELASIIAGGNQIINRVSKKYHLLREEVKDKRPDIVKEFDQRTFDDQWNEYVKNRNEHKSAWCSVKSPVEFETSAFWNVSGDAWGEKQMFGIEYGNGLADENGHEMIFFEATPGDVIAAFYNLNLFYQHDGYQTVNDLFQELNLPRTELGKNLVWDPDVLINEWEAYSISFYTEEMPMEDDVPEPATCTMIYYDFPPEYMIEDKDTCTMIRYDVPPLAKGYAEAMELPDILCPKE